MKTTTLRTLQHPSRLGTLLESLVTGQQWVSPGAPRLVAQTELPAALQRLAVNVVRVDGAWRAWTSYDGIRLFIAEISLELSRERGRPALKISYYNDLGELQKYSHWILLSNDAWQQCAV
jgi:hypothetical protein